jgi:general secretion pathway protein A
MYESFYGFKEKPFNITPDPKYLYLSEQHQEAIAHLLYGIQERGGFVVVTGEIGTGKTTLCRYLINQMDERTEGAIIFNPNLSEIELLKSINEDFGIISTGQTKKELVDELNQFLLEERLRGKNMVLIIDEAQNLHPAVLEQIRMLSNLETEKEKLIQIILTGQPQLKKLLARPELRQLDQRITARYHLKPLNRKETYEYIRHRLEVATDGDHVAFERAAMKRVYGFAKGIPRLINVVCDRALLGAFAVGRGSPIPKKIVKQAIREVIGSRFPIRDRLSFHTTSARVFVYSFALTLAAVLGWYGITTLSTLREPNRGVTEAELIPDLPFERGTEAFPIVKPVEAEAAPAPFPVSADLAPAEEPVLDAPPPMAPYSEEQKKKLTDVLLSQSHEQSRLSAVRNLLSLWGDNPELGAEDVRSLYGLALSRRMRCTELWTNFDGLRCSNAPCILEMFIPQEFRPRYVVLAGLGESDAKILSADAEPLAVPLHLLDEFWLRRAFIFWKDFEHLDEIMKIGDSGGQVVWLQAGLQTLGLYDGLLSGEFDGATETAVREFQRQNSLLLDGIVGPKTKLALYANLPQYSMPRLNGENI